MDKILLTDLTVEGILGIYDFERTTPQPIRINLTLFTDLRRASERDDLRDSVNYAELAEAVCAHAQSAARFTVEALAADIARICLQPAAVASVIVRVEKPQIIPFAAAVGVEIERTRADFGL